MESRSLHILRGGQKADQCGYSAIIVILMPLILLNLPSPLPIIPSEELLFAFHHIW